MKRVISNLVVMVIVAGLLLGLGYAKSVGAESVSDFYKNNTVTLLVTYPPGGGTDFGARIISAYWNQVTGGTMIVKNMAGAGGMRATNYIYKLKPDGLTLGFTDTASTLLSPVIFKHPGIVYDAAKFTYLAATAIEPSGLGIAAGLPYESIQDLQKVKGLKFGAHGVDGQAAGCALMIELFKLKDAKIIPGYSGMSEMGLALRRGEIDAYSNSMASQTDHINKGFVKTAVLVYDRERSPWFPDTPTPVELVKLTPKQEQMYKILLASRSGKPIFAPPGLSAEKTQFIRTAFDNMFKIKPFVRQMKMRWKVMGPGFTQTGAQWAEMTKEVLAMPVDVRDDFIGLVKKYMK